MDLEQWNKLDLLIKNGMYQYVIPTLIKEIKTQVTSEQFDELGDLNLFFNNLFKEPFSKPIKNFIEAMIEHSKNRTMKHFRY